MTALMHILIGVLIGVIITGVVGYIADSYKRITPKKISEAK